MKIYYKEKIDLTEEEKQTFDTIRDIFYDIIARTTDNKLSKLVRSICKDLNELENYLYEKLN